MITSENPYAAPRLDVDDDNLAPPRLTLPRMVAILGIGIVGGGLLGACTNCINGAISPDYFRDVMSWYGMDIWPRAVGQGILEGTVYGLAYGILFVILIAIVSRRRCHFSTAVRYSFGALALTLGFWLLGGLIGVALVWQSPDLMRLRMFGSDPAWPARGYFAWVRGSILFASVGGLFSVLLTIVLYVVCHRRTELFDLRKD